MDSYVRTYSDAVYLQGVKIYYPKPDSNEWRGHATVVGKDGQVVLLKYGGYYVKAHPCGITLVKSQITTCVLEDHTPEKSCVSTLSEPVEACERHRRYWVA